MTMSEPNWSEIQAAFAEPFAPDEIEWKPQSTNQDKTRAMAVAYIDARNVMERLDAAVGAGNWSDRYHVLDNKHVECELTVHGVSKCDVGETNEGGFADPVKSAFSDAFKRAAVKWGIGRYLYALPTQWVACEARGKSVVLKETPTLPAWAIPKDYKQPEKKQKKATPAPANGNGEKPFYAAVVKETPFYASPQDVEDTMALLNLSYPTRADEARQHRATLAEYAQLVADGKSQAEAVATLTKQEQPATG